MLVFTGPILWGFLPDCVVTADSAPVKPIRAAVTQNGRQGGSRDFAYPNAG